MDEEDGGAEGGGGGGVGGVGEGREWGKGIFSCIMQFYEVLGNVNLLVFNWAFGQF